MKDINMTEEWRTVQVFLDDAGVSEVEVNLDDSSDVRCNCAQFKKSKECKHGNFVLGKMEDNGGHFSIQVPDTVDEDVSMNAFQSAESFRDFVLHYAKIEVLD